MVLVLVENTVVNASLMRCVSSVMSSLCSGLVLVMMDGWIVYCILCEMGLGLGWCRMFVCQCCFCQIFITSIILDRV